jgi:hypothetical protein
LGKSFRGAEYWDYSTSSPRPPNDVATIRASILTLEAIGTTVTFPLTIPDLYHHYKYSQASRIFSPGAFLSGVKVLLVALKTRSHCVAILGQDKYDGGGHRQIRPRKTLLQCEEDTVRRDGGNA